MTEALDATANLKADTKADLTKIRTDVVGSLLRPAALREARMRFDDGAIVAAEFRAIEDQAVRDAVRLQEDAGLDVVTDGEMRRLNFQDSFGASVEGYDANRSTVKVYERRVEGAAPGQRWDISQMHDVGTAVSHRRPAKSRLKLAHDLPLEEYLFAAAVARKPAKVSLIGPDRISQRFAYENSTAVYRDMDEFLADVVAIERQIVTSLVEAGCRYVHIDAPGFTAYVDAPSMQQMRERGEDPEQNFARSLKAEAAVTANFPGVTFGIHLCRGNQRSMWHREGSYDAIAEQLFNTLPHDRFLLEYDTDRARLIRAVALRAEGQGGCARSGQHQGTGTGIGRDTQAPHRRGEQSSAARSARYLTAMRLRLRCGRKPPRSRRSEAEIGTRRRSSAAGVGIMRCNATFRSSESATRRQASSRRPKQRI
jgi:5-methyltetrahydropteroyltriglutamate--homocysteine methyltransferase